MNSPARPPARFRRRLLSTVASATLLLAAGVTLTGAGIAISLAAASTAEAGESATATVKADPGTRTDISATLYADGATSIRDIRRADLSKGKQTVDFGALPDTVDPDTLNVDSSGGTVVSVDGILLNGGELSLSALYAANVGRSIGWVFPTDEDGPDSDISTVRLIDDSPNVVIDFGGRIMADPPGRPVFDHLPEGLAPARNVSASIDAADRGIADFVLRYDMGGIGYSTVYDLTLGKAPSLSGNVNLRNDTDARFDGLAVRIVAGERNREMPPVQPLMTMRAEAKSFGDAAGGTMPAPAERTGDLFAFDLPDRVSLAPHANMIRPLFADTGVSVHKSYVLESRPQFYPNGISRSAAPVSPSVRIDFDLPETVGAMPAGRLRVHDEKTATVLGEDRLPNMGVGAHVEATLGRAFTIRAERTLTDFKRTGTTGAFEAGQQVKLENTGDEDAEVTVTDYLNGDWTILEESMKATSSDGASRSWMIPVPAHGTTTLTYRVHIKP